MSRLFHVSSAANRQSILAHGLDWTLMGAAPGIAGSPVPEEEGVFLCRDDFETTFIMELNNTGGPVDVWEVTGIGEDELITTDSGFCYFPGRIPSSQLTLVSWPPEPAVPASPRMPGKQQRKKKPRPGK